MDKRHLNTFEEKALHDPDVKFGFDNYEILRQMGELVREIRAEENVSQRELQELTAIDQAEISRLEVGSLKNGPTLLTLVRLAHALGKRLVIGLEEADSSAKSDPRLLRL